ncbi:MAG: hypothetical protein GX896_00980 [Clostridiales bacterium]|nr:hypothetical protein [Clostridiales bacterium]
MRARVDVGYGHKAIVSTGEDHLYTAEIKSGVSAITKWAKLSGDNGDIGKATFSGMAYN